MMTRISPQKGMLIFGIFILLAGIAALVAFQVSGPMGIEERFTQALGIHHDASADSGISGFSLEGQPFLYVVVLGILGIICIAAYRHFRI